MTAVAQTASLPIIATGSLQSYLDSVQQLPILTAGEERELFQQFQEQEDLEVPAAWCYHTSGMSFMLPAAIPAMACRSKT